jgi:hypothetical protein
MIIAMCLLILHGFSIIANLVLVAQLAGLFINQSFSGSCYLDQQDSYKCPLGIELNSFNYVRLHRYYFLTFISFFFFDIPFD